MKGGRATLEGVYRAELRPLYGFLWRLGAQESEMDDLVHDVFLTAMRRWETYDEARPVRPWLYGIAFRVFSDGRKRRSAQPSEPVSEALEAGGVAPDEAVAQRQAQALLQRALASLPEERRVAFVLHELEGLAVAEVAQVTGAPAPTIYSRLKTARDEVAAAVARFQLAEARRGEAR